MYLLRKIGIPLAVVLIIAVLTLIWVVLIYNRDGLLLPRFDRPETDPHVTTAPIEPEITVNNNYENTIIPFNGGTRL